MVDPVPPVAVSLAPLPPVPPPTERILSRRIYLDDPAAVAQTLLGCALISRTEGAVTGGIIVETEAYLAQDDPASHSRRGPTPRSASMFADPGTLYVYMIHARYCLNLVTEQKGRGSAVLVRALEPVWGIETMEARRGHSDLRRLCGGPAMLCQALAVDRSHDGTQVTGPGPVSVARLPRGRRATSAPFSVGVSPRIGIREAAELPLRFFVRGSHFVSRPA